jgi:hypothetical protein
MVVPTGWTETSSKTSEVQIIQLTAPLSYGNAPSRVTVDSYIGIVASTVTARRVADQEAQRESTADAQFAAGPVTDCQLQSDTAAFFSFTRGAATGYHVFLIHNQLLYDAIIQGNGGVSNQFILDSKAVLGSWNWRV